MADELWTTGSEAARRLDLLTEQWDGVRNAALGRGVNPLVSAALADSVANDWAAFHSWRDTLGGWTLTSSWVDELTEWTRRCNAARAAIASELARKPPPAGSPALPGAITEWHETLPAIATNIASVFAGAGGLALGLGLVFLLARRHGGK